MEQRHSCATGTSAYRDDLGLPGTPVQCQPLSEVASSQSPTLNTHLDRPRGLRRHKRTRLLLNFKGWDSENMMTTDHPLALP